MKKKEKRGEKERPSTALAKLLAKFKTRGWKKTVFCMLFIRIGEALDWIRVGRKAEKNRASILEGRKRFWGERRENSRYNGDEWK